MMKRTLLVLLLSICLLSASIKSSEDAAETLVDETLVDQTLAQETPVEETAIDTESPLEASEPKLFNGFTQEQLDTIEQSGEKREFQAEVSRLLDILINSLYTQKEVFLREAVSNAADALDKMRYLSVQDPSLLGENTELDVRLTIDKEGKTISIRDTGIGMTKSELVNNLGTIAHTGTTQFLEAISQGGSLNLIGQFGVGFYSYFLIANKVTVISKHTDDDQYIWESHAGSTFTMLPDPRGNTMTRGTEIILHLKQDAHEYLDIEKVQG
jgi:heat shock protein beta